jgi:ribose/xylose/arabinose/galactoside ABC-type transport system permease subunit
MSDGSGIAEQPRAGPTRNQRIGAFLRASLRAYGIVIAIIVIAMMFQAANPAFLRTDNLLVLVRSMASLAMIGFAELLVIILGEIDLSVGAVYGLAAVTFIVFWTGGGNAPFQVPFIVALLLGLGVGLLSGAVVAFFTTVVGIPSFIATLGMLSIAQGTELLLSNASDFNPAYMIPAPPQAELDIFRALGATKLPFGIPIQVLWLAFFFVVFWIIRHRTLFGFRLLAIGGNREASRVARLPVSKYYWIAFMLCGLMSAIAGILDMSYIGSIGPGSGLTLTFPVFAAVVIGGASLMGGRGTVFGVLIGATLLAVIRNGLALLGIGAFGGLIVTGVVTIAAVTFDRLTHGKQTA